MSQWENTQRGFRPKDYQCAFCGRDVSASTGYWCVGEDDALLHTIAICPKCNSPTYFERHLTQIPSPPFGDSVPFIKDGKIEAIYEQARWCTSYGAFTAAVMLCRKLLMNIAVQQGATENQSFQTYVEYLANELPRAVEGVVIKVYIYNTPRELIETRKFRLYQRAFEPTAPASFSAFESIRHLPEHYFYQFQVDEAQYTQ